MNGIFVDRKFKTVTVQAGARWIDVVRAVAPNYVACPHDCSTGTGIILAGGFGPLLNSHGLVMDTLLQFDLIKYNQEQIIANANENDELYWALRGAGPLSFGVVTSFTLEIYDNVRPFLYTMKRRWNLDTAGKVLKHWGLIFNGEGSGGGVGSKEWDRETVTLVILTKSGIVMENLYFGEPENGPKACMFFDVPQIPPVETSHNMVSFLEWTELHRSRDMANRIITKSGFVPQLDDELINLLVGSDVVHCPDGGEYNIFIEFIFGAVTELSPVYTPFPHRARQIHIICTANYRTNEDEWDSWSDYFGESLSKKRTGISLNYIDSHTPPQEKPELYWGSENYAIIKAIKKVHDPRDFFTITQELD